MSRVAAPAATATVELEVRPLGEPAAVTVWFPAVPKTMEKVRDAPLPDTGVAVKRGSPEES